MSDLETEKECCSIESGLHSIVVSYFNIDTPVFYHYVIFLSCCVYYDHFMLKLITRSVFGTDALISLSIEFWRNDGIHNK